MHPATFTLLLPLALALAHAHAIPAPFPRDATTAVALVSGYTNDSCTYPPFGDYVLDFEPSGENRCVGNGTVAKGVYVSQLKAGCVVNAFTFANCTGERYELKQVGCWVQFEVNDVDFGVQGVSVSCNGTAVASTGASASASTSESVSSSASASASASSSTVTNLVKW